MKLQKHLFLITTILALPLQVFANHASKEPVVISTKTVPGETITDADGNVIFVIQKTIHTADARMNIDHNLFPSAFIYVQQNSTKTPEKTGFGFVAKDSNANLFICQVSPESPIYDSVKTIMGSFGLTSNVHLERGGFTDADFPSDFTRLTENECSTVIHQTGSPRGKNI